MARPTLDRLLRTLCVRLQGCSVSDIGPLDALAFEAAETVSLHHVVAGCAWLAVDGDQAPVPASGLIVVPAGVPIRLGATANFDSLHRVDVFGSGGFAAGEPEPGGLRVLSIALEATFAGTLSLFEDMPEPFVDGLEGAPVIGEVLALLAAELASPQVGSEAASEAAIKLALVLLIRRRVAAGLALSPAVSALGDQRLASVVGQVIKEPGALLSLADLAKAAGMSRSSFTKAFSAAFGQTPMEFVQRTRLEHAEQLLTTTDLPVKAVASNLGFASRSHFSRAFRHAYGLDPTAYRANKGS